MYLDLDDVSLRPVKGAAHQQVKACVVCVSRDVWNLEVGRTRGAGTIMVQGGT